MNPIILSLLIKAFCDGWIAHEYGNYRYSSDLSTREEIAWDYESCIENTNKAELFAPIYNVNNQDIRI
jgi:hypothetical protein